MSSLSTSAAKEREINYLRNQLKLRDDIIKDQKSILEARNRSHDEDDNALNYPHSRISDTNETNLSPKNEEKSRFEKLKVYKVKPKNSA